MSDGHIHQLLIMQEAHTKVLAELVNSLNKQRVILKVLVAELSEADPAIADALHEAGGDIQELEHVFRLHQPKSPEPLG